MKQKRPGKPQPGLQVFSMESVVGQTLLARQNLAAADINEALERYMATEQQIIGTFIGVTQDGLFAAAKRNWHSGLPDAFAEPLISSPGYRCWNCSTGFRMAAPANCSPRGVAHPIEKAWLLNRTARYYGCRNDQPEGARDEHHESDPRHPERCLGLLGHDERACQRSVALGDDSHL